jgi:naphthoate synthase
MAHDLLLPAYLKTDEAKELSASMQDKRKPDSTKFGH